MVGYEIFVRSYRDTNEDGIGDIRGIEESISYFLSLGVNLLWLMPIFKSPSFHGYDVMDFKSVNPLYGDIEDFKRLISTLHGEGIKVILDFPLQHTSSLHPWFEKALSGDENFRNYYLWSEREEVLLERREWDGQPVWHPSPSGHYRGLFGAGLPDLNYSNEEVSRKMKEILKYWFDMGIDGVRLDAAKHIFEDSKQNKRFWGEFLKDFEGKMFIGEIWASQDTVDEYGEIFGYVFNFLLSYSIKESVKRGDPDLLIEGIQESLKDKRYIPVNFLTNHDMTRLADEIEDERKRKLAFSILMTLPGIPFIFYGEELGMKGRYDPFFTEDVLEPFPWRETLYTRGQTMWKSFKYLRAHSGFSVEANESREDSLLNHIKELGKWRRSNPWIDVASIDGLERRGSAISYELVGERRIRIFHNFSKEEVEIEGIPLKPYESFIAKG